MAGLAIPDTVQQVIDRLLPSKDKAGNKDFVSDRSTPAPVVWCTWDLRIQVSR